MKFFHLTTLTLISLVASEAATEPQGPQTPYLFYGLTKLESLLTASDPIFKFITDTMGLPEADITPLKDMVHGLESAAKSADNVFASLTGKGAEKEEKDEE